MMSGSVETKIARFLFNYRMTPQGTTGSTPAELLMKQNLRSCLDLLMPDVSNRVFRAQEQQKTNHDLTAKDRQFIVGDHVMVHNHVQDPDWVSVSITEQNGPVSYNVRVHDTNQIWQRHIDAIWNYSSENVSVDFSVDNNLQVSPVPTSDHEQQAVNDLLSDEMVTGCPKQTIRPPDRLDILGFLFL